MSVTAVGYARIRHTHRNVKRLPGKDMKIAVDCPASSHGAFYKEVAGHIVAPALTFSIVLLKFVIAAPNS